MKHFELKGQIRETGNQAAINALRKQGLVPCNLYGQGIKNVLFTISEKDLKGLTHTPNSYIVDLSLSDGSKYQAVLHVSEDKPISINVPITITGHAAGVQAGGKFFQLQRKLRISALMKDLPDTVTIDITKLKIGNQIVAGDIHIDKVSILTLKDTILCAVRTTRQVSSAEETETEEEGEENQAAE